MHVATARVGERQIRHTNFEGVRAADPSHGSQHEILCDDVVGGGVEVAIGDRATRIQDDATASVGEQLHRHGIGLGELHPTRGRVDRIERDCGEVDVARIAQRAGVAADAGGRSQI